MKSIVNSQLTGKWYKHTRDSHSHELNFVEIFIYLSHKVNGQRSVNNNHLDLLYVGVKDDRSSILRNITLRIIFENGFNYIIVRKFLLCKKFKVLLFDEINGILILSGNRMKNISIYSRKYKLQLVMIEDYLKKIELEDPIKIILEEN